MVGLGIRMSPKPPNTPWKPSPDDNPVVREPQAKHAPRVVVAFFEADADERSVLSARDKAEAIGGVSVTVHLITATFNHRHRTVYVLYAKTKFPSRFSREMGRIAKNLHHAPSVEGVFLFVSTDAAKKAVVDRVAGNWNIARSNLRLRTLDH